MPPNGTLGSTDTIDEEAVVSDSKFLWSNILKEVTHKASFKLPSTRALIVLGDDECGKTTLIAKLQGTEDPKKSFGLEYTFVDIKDEERDDKTKLNVWILGGDITHSRLLKFALNSKNFGECVALIVVDMSEPWKIMSSLEKWSSLLEKHINRLSIPPETLSEYKNGLSRQFREYIEPDSLLMPTSNLAPIAHAPIATAPINARRPLPPGLHPATAALLSSTLYGSQPATDPTTPAEVTETEGADNGEVNQQADATMPNEPPFDGTTMSENLGIQMVVVVTKTDSMNVLEKEERFTEEHFDFIQMHVRRFCLKYGAALFYVSVKENKHCDLLNRYLQSRIYGFPFTQAAYVVERDCVFVPTGWDSEKKIAILEENFAQLRSADAYDDVINSPAPRKALVREPELQSLDEQSFLTRLLADVQREGNNNATGNGSIAGAGGDGGLLEKLSGTPPGSGGARSGTASPRISTPTGMRPKPSPPGSGGVVGVNPGGNVSTGSPVTNPRASEGVLATFFTSLLNKRSNATGGTGPATPTQAGPGDKIGMSPKDIQSELERLAQSSRESLGVTKTGKSKSEEGEETQFREGGEAPSDSPQQATPKEAAAPGKPE